MEDKRMGASERRALTPDERMEYEEIGRCQRHDMDVVMDLSKVMLPIALGMVPVAAARQDLVWPLAFASVLLYLYYCAVADHHMRTKAWRQDRANELEEAAGLDHYRLELRRVHASRWPVFLHGKYLRWAMLPMLVFAYWWIAHHGAGPSQT